MVVSVMTFGNEWARRTVTSVPPMTSGRRLGDEERRNVKLLYH
jgi:hypothetical protein